MHCETTMYQSIRMIGRSISNQKSIEGIEIIEMRKRKMSKFCKHIIVNEKQAINYEYLCRGKYE